MRRTFSGRGKDLPSALLIFGTLIGVDPLFIYMALAGGLQNLWWTGGLLILFLAITVYVAKPTFHALAKKTLEIDDAGVRWRISGRLDWELAWDDIKSAHSINQYVPDDIPVRGFGLKSKDDKEYNLGDLPDMGPTDQLEEAFNIIGEELVRRGARVEDEAGWAGAAILADKVEKGEMSTDPEVEGRWLKSGYDMKSIVGNLVLGLVLLMLSLLNRFAPLFKVGFVVISLASMGIVGYLLVWRNVSGILFDEKRVVLSVGLFKKRELALDWSEIEHLRAGPSGEPATIHLRSGSVYRAFFPLRIIDALRARYGAFSRSCLQGHYELEPVNK